MKLGTWRMDEKNWDYRTWRYWKILGKFLALSKLATRRCKIEIRMETIKGTAGFGIVSPEMSMLSIHLSINGRKKKVTDTMSQALLGTHPKKLHLAAPKDLRG